ncbi:hypothetical protein B0H14DRAFT_2641987 [Mycena olivaceomarginata]|nr:hypothetical protein B0H14DRAFT_2641987 [Mycena olivaceomarginata]
MFCRHLICYGTFTHFHALAASLFIRVQSLLGSNPPPLPMNARLFLGRSLIYRSHILVEKQNCPDDKENVKHRHHIRPQVREGNTLLVWDIPPNHDFVGPAELSRSSSKDGGPAIGVCSLGVSSVHTRPAHAHSYRYGLHPAARSQGYARDGDDVHGATAGGATSQRHQGGTRTDYAGATLGVQRACRFNSPRFIDRRVPNSGSEPPELLGHKERLEISRFDWLKTIELMQKIFNHGNFRGELCSWERCSGAEQKLDVHQFLVLRIPPRVERGLHKECGITWTGMCRGTQEDG